ncbi:ATP-binding protein [Rheinheimera sp. YQF-2]|uniref:ATP-binding protein n=1 Tax=Rheinheimera lutimaris TaxID=2740584 RepID=A0A7Y5ATS2_9GAMM|nr:ATP-binding protein [Rheinheimera lutimaris]NRQ43806.1 ATP-binding protein [Rheinheimera lutimaris]
MFTGAVRLKDEVTPDNAACLQHELDWLARCIELRLHSYFQQQPLDLLQQAAAPDLTAAQGSYAAFVRKQQLTTTQRLILLLALAPHLQPQLLDTFFVRNDNLARNFTEFGGCSSKQHQGFLPSAQTAAFLLAANDLSVRLQVIQLLQPDQLLCRDNIIHLRHDVAEEPFLSAQLTVSAEYLQLFCSGTRQKPDYNIHFPAKLLTTPLTWQDLVLPAAVMAEVQHIIGWAEHQDTVMQQWQLSRSIKPGYRALFYGPPGTGKTLTATLIGRQTGADVYRIDLSAVVSKYIGETEKNLATVFDQAQARQWILFFDEADALFGKRSQTSSSNDRYANQQVSYLLQRIEDFPGVVLLASNLKANIDEAFARRFQSMLYFPLPDVSERHQLWQHILGKHVALSDDVDLHYLAHEFELAGGAITNVVRYAAIAAVLRHDRALTQADLLQGISRERRKEGMMV